MQAKDVVFFMPFIKQITQCILASPQLPSLPTYLATPALCQPCLLYIHQEKQRSGKNTYRLIATMYFCRNIITKAVVLPLCANEQVNLGALHLHVRARKASDPWYQVFPSFCNEEIYRSYLTWRNKKYILHFDKDQRGIMAVFMFILVTQGHD